MNIILTISIIFLFIIQTIYHIFFVRCVYLGDISDLQNHIFLLEKRIRKLELDKLKKINE
jgi:hypothetical protein